MTKKVVVFLVVAPKINWKGCRLSWTALPYAWLKESEWFHPKGYPLFGGWLQK